jgi:hypothetical protein
MTTQITFIAADGLAHQVSSAYPLPTTGGGGGGNPAGDGVVGTGATTAVASLTTLQTILAANTARYGATVYNDDANSLYLLLGAGTVTSSVYTVQIPGGGYYEVPYGFTGILTGLWAADGAGSARVTEFT